MIQGRHCVAVAGFIILLWTHPFLAVNRPVNARVMVVEGWIPAASLQYAADLIQTANYELILTNGGRRGSHPDGDDATSYAALSREQLISMGIDAQRIIAIETTHIRQGRTISYARSTMEWLRHNRATTKAVNVLTLGTHARKSYVLYKKASENELNVGIISAPAVGYHPLYWFASVEGAKFVLKNLFGYLHAMVL